MRASLPPEMFVDGDRYFHIPGAEADTELLHSVVDRLQAAFGRWPGFEIPVEPLEHLRWKLAKPGVARPLLSLIERSRGDLITTLVLLPRTYLLGGRSVHVADWCDASVAPAVQGQGYYRKSRDYARQAEDGFELALSFSRNPRILSTWAPTESSAPANEIRTMIHPLRSWDFAGQQTANPVARTAVAAVTVATSRVGRLRYGRRVPRAGTVDINQIEKFDQRADQLFTEAATAYDFVEVRDAEFLNWRYCDDRAGLFESFAATEGDDLVGYAVLAVRGARAALVDLLVAPSRLDVAAALVRESIVRATAHEAAAVHVWLPRHHQYRNLLLGHGFVDVGARNGVNARPISLSDEDDELIRRRRTTRLHLMQGDTDSV